jgi:poly(3-hydroxybutyrate) depolymerase/CubicO group peptidase (beta-lactamase class C family)
VPGVRRSAAPIATAALAAALAFAFLLAGWHAGAQAPPAASPQSPTQTTAPAPQASPWSAAAAYSRQSGGEVLLVLRDGKVVFEDSVDGWDSDRPHPLASGTKSFTGVAAMLAVQQGLITLDERVSDTITEWKDDPRKRAITVRQLLDLSSGLQPDSAEDRQRIRSIAGGGLLERARAARARPDDFQAQALEAPAEHEPGSRFEYGGNHFHAFGAFLERRLAARGVKPATAWEWYEANLLEPIGMKVARIGRDRAGHPNLPGGASASAAEWAKFGEFVRLNGAVRAADGSARQVLTPELLAKCFEPSARNDRYGLTWWLGPRGGDDTLPDVRMAAGLGNQRLYVIPSAELVAVRFAPLNGGKRGFSDEEMIRTLLEAAGAAPRAFPAIETGMESRLISDGIPAPEPTQPDATLPWVTPAVSAPRVTFHTFDSASVKGKVSYHLYTPAEYARDGARRFPVVYWLHGSGGGQEGIPPLAKRFDAAIEAGKAPPFLVVFVNGLPQGMYVDWADGRAPVESMIVRDLVPHVDATLRTVASREGRLLDGFSMGGYGAARLGFKFPETFRAVSMLGAGPLDPDFERTPRANPRSRDGLLERVYGSREHFREVSPWELAKANAGTIAKGSLVRIAVGDRDGTFALNKEFHDHLDALKIPHEWSPLAGVEHDPSKTLDALGDRTWAFYRRAFDGAAAPAPAPRADGPITVKVKGVDRRAIVVNAPAAGSTRPAVLVLHGGMGSADQMRATSGFDRLAREKGFIAAYPEGTDFGGGRHAWNTGSLLRRQVRDADDIAFLDALIDTLVRDHGADPARIFMTGGSNGGMMTYVYAVARPERLAAAAPVVASMFTFDGVPKVPLPILIVNGAKDEEVPLAGGMSGNQLVRNAQAAPFKPVSEVVDFWVKANRSKPDPSTKVDGTVTTASYAAGPDGAATEFVLDSAGGHGWPGTASRREGNVPISSFRGAERVWAFFEGKARK